MTVQQTALAIAALLHDPNMSLARLGRLLTRQLLRNEEARIRRWRSRGRVAPRAGVSRGPFRLICRAYVAQ
jgi:hypothetical protein